MSNKVYTAQWNLSIAAAGSATAGFNIQSVGREIKIKSITLEWYMAQNGVNTPIPWRTTTTESIVLYVGGFGNKFASSYDNLTGALVASNGYQVVITEPKQLFFDSFFVPNNLQFSFVINNFAAFIVDHLVCITVETEEHTMFL